MRTLQDTLRSIINLPQEKKVRLAADSYLKILPLLRRIDADSHGIWLLCAILGSAAGADSVISPAETALVRAILQAEGLAADDEAVEDIVSRSSGMKAHEMIRKLAGIMNPEERAALVTLIGAVCAIDDSISLEEFEYIDSVLKA